MRFGRTERDEVVEVRTAALSGDGWRSRLSLKRSGSCVLKLLVLAALVAAGAWAYQANFGPGAKPAMDMNMRATSGATPFPVTLGKVERGTVTGTVVYTGSVAPFNEEDIYPRVTGRIVEMPVYPGDAVRAGQVVARLDDVELSSRVREAEAMAATSQANRAQMEADLVAAQHGIVQMDKELAMVEAEVGYARGVAARSERLVASGAIARQEYENDRAMAAALEAKREAARAKLAQAQAMEASARKKLEAGEAMVAQGRATLRTATVVRDYVTIVAPGTGYVVKRLVAPGVLVQPGTAILKIAQIDRVRLQANVGERDLASIRTGSPVTVTTTAGLVTAARVTSVFPFVEQGGRTAVVEAVVDNAGRRLLPGQYVTMQFVTGERADALSVPRGAVARLGGTATVWVVKDGRAEPREVTAGLESPERVEIVRGLAGDERVIARGHEGLYAGARVADVGGAKPAAADAPTQKTTPGMLEKPASPEAPKDKNTPGMPGMRH
ncbi:MAG: efflux RND transporter periplasmic adaptor subunit [Candidatus Rokubacteria bacterium]|nr:efflux RND transporter periplasmic adaptor subunit [Candidatus Rokubacteria bacterium]